MSQVFIALNADNVGELIGNHIVNDNHDELSRVSAAIKSAQDMVNRWAESKGGKVVVSSGDESILCIPKQALAELKNIKNQYSQLANTTLTVGVGATMSEASKALIYGKMNDKNQVVHYDPSIDAQIAGEEESDEDGLPSPDGIEQDGNESEQQESGLADDPEAAGVDDGNGDEDNNPNEIEDQAMAEGGENPADYSGNNEEIPDNVDGNGDEDNNPDEMYDDGNEPTTQDAEIENELDQDADEALAEEDNMIDQDGDDAQNQPQDQEDDHFQEFQDDEIPAEEDESQEFDPSQPPHEQGMDEEENLEHDAEENEDDEQDSDNIEADEEPAAFGGNTEPEDADFAEDVAEDVADQDLDAQAMGDEQIADDENALQDDQDFGQEQGEMEGEEDPMLSQDDVANPADQDPNAPQDEGDDESVMTDMLHANIGDEESEDSDDEVKQDVIESLMSFKQNKQHLEELKQTNPEMYQANIMMLRAMIQMAKKLKMNPEAGMEDQDMAAQAQDEFPPADENEIAEDESEQDPLPNPETAKEKQKPAVMGKSENLNKSSRADRDVSASARYNRRIKATAGDKKQIGIHRPVAATEAKVRSSGTSQAGMQAKKRPHLAVESHKKVLSEQKKMPKPNLPKSEVMKGFKDEQKGVHKPYMSQGESMAGEMAREGKNKPKTAHTDMARKMHSQKLNEQKQMPKPNLPKSEHDTVRSFKQGDRVVHNIHGAGTVAGSHGQGIHSVNFDIADRHSKPTKVHEKNFQQKQAQKPMQKPAQNNTQRPAQPTDIYAQKKPIQKSEKKTEVKGKSVKKQ